MYNFFFFVFVLTSHDFVSTAQVPDDEQFVPDFQPDSCEYLSFNIYTLLPCTLDQVQRRQGPLRERIIIHVLFQFLVKSFERTKGTVKQKLV